MPSQQQNSRLSHDFSHDYLSANPLGNGIPISRSSSNKNNNAKLENYKRIKQEEAAARAQLRLEVELSAGSSPYTAGRVPMVDISDLNSIAVNRRNPGLLDRKFKPSANALASYSPLR